MTGSRAWPAALLAALALACKNPPTEGPQGALESPQANAEPAPLAHVPTVKSATPAVTAAADAGPPPEPMRGDRALSADVVPVPKEPKEVVRDRDGGVVREVPARDAKELAGYTLTFAVRTDGLPGAHKAPEVNAQALEAARRKTEPRLTVELAAGRARMVTTGAFVLPPGTELRARLDRYGHVLLLPGEDSYRVAAPGALRALLGERRLDVAPLAAGEVRDVGEGTKRLNVRTRRVSVASRAAQGFVEVAQLKDAGEAGVLVFRALLDLMAVAPQAGVLGADEIPLHAELRWNPKGALVFDAVSVERRTNIAIALMAAPPSTHSFTAAPLGPATSGALVPRAEVTAFRTAAAFVDAPPRDALDAQPAPEGSGLTLVNGGDQLRVAWLDGVPIAWVAAGGREELPQLLRGRYMVQWRTFLGDVFEPPQLVVVPGVTEASPDAGVR